MVLNGLLPSFIAAVQASLSVLLVISYGAIAARLGLLNSNNGKAISKICVKMFLPALLLIQIGSELHPGSAHRYLIVFLWALICHLLSFMIGTFAHLVFGLPDWVTVAIMFNNTTSYPLLLIQSLEQTGILSKLLVEDETTRQVVERTKSYFLVFATVSSCLTFAVGPRLIDTEHAPDSDDDSTTDGERGIEPSTSGARSEDGHLENGTRTEQASEQTRLLSRRPQFRERHESVTNIAFFPSKPKYTTIRRRPYFVPSLHWHDLSARTQWWLLFLFDFVAWPLMSIGVIFAVAKRSSAPGSDPMLWFAMMLMPTGPPAMGLITMVQVSDAGIEEERKIAKILTVFYVISPVLAFVVVGALYASEAAM